MGCTYYQCMRVLEEMKTTIMSYISLIRVRGTPGPGVWFAWLGQEEEMKTTSIYWVEIYWEKCIKWVVSTRRNDDNSQYFYIFNILKSYKVYIVYIYIVPYI